ncbi:MAG: hypothetical protein WD795_15870 [Woeseia sp.]
MKSKCFLKRVSITGLTALLGFALLMSACSNAEDQDSSTAAKQAASSGVEIDPCALVTDAEAGEALGGTVETTERPPEANHPNLATCRYVAPIGQKVGVLVVMVHSQEMSSYGFQTAREQPFDVQSVSGVGDDAFWIGDVNTLYVLQGGLFLSIGGDVALGQMQTLATKALERAHLEEDTP